MSEKAREHNRNYRARLKARGSRQFLLTLDPVCLAAAQRISELQPGSRTDIIRAALLTHCALLEIKLSAKEFYGDNEP
jgi:hypothetical protein